jgi:hypothetical protein
MEKQTRGFQDSEMLPRQVRAIIESAGSFVFVDILQPDVSSHGAATLLWSRVSL